MYPRTRINRHPDDRDLGYQAEQSMAREYRKDRGRDVDQRALQAALGRLIARPAPRAEILIQVGKLSRRRQLIVDMHLGDVVSVDPHIGRVGWCLVVRRLGLGEPYAQADQQPGQSAANDK